MECFKNYSLDVKGCFWHLKVMKHACLFFFFCLFFFSHGLYPHAETVDTAVVLPAVVSPVLSDPQEVIGLDSCVPLFDLINSMFLCFILIHGADP